MLLMSIIAAYGLFKIKDIIYNFSNSKKTIKFKLILILIITVFISFQQNAKICYYHVVNDNDYEKFVWIKENTNEDEIVLADPWKVMTLILITGRRVVSLFALKSTPNYEDYTSLNTQIFNFFKNKCNNTEFLIENNVSIVYFPVECGNDNI